MKNTEITFMGHQITSAGLQADPEKVKAITEMKSPSNVKELRRFLGLVNYLGKFLPHFSAVAERLRNLTKNDVPWNWSEVQESAMHELKCMITQTPVLAFYDPTKDLMIENDACEYGLGSVLLQDDKPIAYASRSLSDAETRYAQIESEMLAVVFGLEKFHHYAYGRHVKISTDHKPLVSIVTKPLSSAPRRPQGLILRTQCYDYSLQYRSGKSIPIPDTLSRAPLQDADAVVLETVSNVSLCAINTSRLDRTGREFEQFAQHDHVWLAREQSISATVDIHLFQLPRRLGIVLRGERVVILSSMRADTKRRIHAGHLEINSCLRRAHDIVFWPGMSSEIRQFVESCHICATYCDKQPQETISMHDVCSRPWEKVGTDLFTIDHRDYLVTVDYASGFIEVDYLPDTLSETIITKMKHHFARYGTPDTVVSDGGPQYTSISFKHFSDSWQFEHVITSPGNSKANGAAEATVKSVKKLMRKCIAAHEDPYLGLLNLGNTPVEGINLSPTQLMFGQQTKSTLPTTV